MTHTNRVFAVLIAAVLVALVAACTPAPDRIAAVTPLPSATATPLTLTDTNPQPAGPVTATPAAADTTATPTSTPTIAPTESNATPTLTPTPWEVDLSSGDARLIALATDVAFRPTQRAPVELGDSPVSIRFDEFYLGYDLRTGLLISDKLLALDGQTVVMEGFMAPPLKANLDFFVLTRIQLAICPFCSTDADWPNDMALIYLPPNQSTAATDYPVRVTGQIEIGSSIDLESGMVSLVRIYADKLEQLR